MTLDQAIDRYTNNAEYERRNGSLHGCMEFRQLAEWLKDYKRLLNQQPCDDTISRGAVKEIINDIRDCISVEGYCAILERLKKLPPVTQKPKYWIDKDNKIYKMPDDIPTMTIQYPTITHEDTISRTEVMNVISDFVVLEKYVDKHNHITFEPLEQMINSLPSVTPTCEEREKGECPYYAG